jgi:cell division protein FtsQ
MPSKPPQPTSRSNTASRKSTGASSRTDARQAQRPPRPSDVRRARRHVLLFLYAALAIELTIAAFTSPALEIKQVRVEGAGHLPEQEMALVMRAVTLSSQTNWILAPVGEMEKRLRALPWVRQVEVKRGLSNTVEALIVTREPAVIAQAGKSRFEVDGDAVPIRAERPEMVGRIPVVDLEGAPTLRTGVPVNGSALKAAIHIYGSVRHDARVRMAKIVVDQSGNLCLNMLDGVPIQFGQDDEIPAKLASLRRIYTREPDIARRLAAINLSCPSWPACTPRVATPPSLQSTSKPSADGTAESGKQEARQAPPVHP